jgi:hypothetical protein
VRVTVRRSSPLPRYLPARPPRSRTLYRPCVSGLRLGVPACLALDERGLVEDNSFVGIL